MEKKGKCRRRGAVRLGKIRYNRECLSTESIRFSSVPPSGAGRVAKVQARTPSTQRPISPPRFFPVRLRTNRRNVENATAAERESVS